MRGIHNIIVDKKNKIKRKIKNLFINLFKAKVKLKLYQIDLEWLLI